MIGHRNKNILLGISAFLNVLLVVGVFWMKSYADRSVVEVSNIAIDSQLTVQKHVLSELESATPDLEKLKTFLRAGIDGAADLKADIARLNL